MDDAAPSLPSSPPAGAGEAPGSARSTGRPLADSYWLSSLELLGGVEVEVVGVRAVPTEALREFMRMHEAWRQPDRAEARPEVDFGTTFEAPFQASFQAAGPAEEPATPSTFDLDITLGADGRVTLPGDLAPAGS